MVSDPVAVQPFLQPACAAQHHEVVSLVTIHHRRPRGYWVRMWTRRRGGLSLPRDTHHRTSLRTSRVLVPKGMKKAPRSDGDADDLVEVWR